MYTTEIKIGKKVVPIRFGGYVQQLLYEDGIKATDLGLLMKENPFGIFPKIFYFGAINASENWQGKDITLREIYEWVDSLDGGLFSKEASELIELFTDQMSKGVPQPEEKPKKTAPKAEKK